MTIPRRPPCEVLGGCIDNALDEGWCTTCGAYCGPLVGDTWRARSDHHILLLHAAILAAQPTHTPTALLPAGTA